LSTILGHTDSMPDDSSLSPRADFPATESGLEFIMEQIARLPTRWELAKYSFVLSLRRCGTRDRGNRGFLALRSGMRLMSTARRGDRMLARIGPEPRSGERTSVAEN
jgi:hypothetical protein